MDIIETIAHELGVSSGNVKAAVELIDGGSTVPFIARYRKEATGNMGDVALRKLEERLAYLRGLAARKQEVLSAIGEQGKLTPELQNSIQAADTMQRVGDLYKPFRKKRATRASKARDAGLESLANLILAQANAQASPLEQASKYVNPDAGFPTADAALQGAKDIVAETIAENPDAVADLRAFTEKTGSLCVEATDPAEQGVYDRYYGFSEALRRIPNHRVLAINRGEKEGKLKVRVSVDADAAIARLGKHAPRRRGAFADALDDAVVDGYKRLMAPSLERGARAELTVRAQRDAIRVFAQNTRSLLLQRPVRGARIIALDPGYRTGCKVAVLDENGKLLDHTTVYPTPPRSDVAGTKRVLDELAKRHHANTVVIGNGTGSRETEEVVSDFIAVLAPDMRYTIVNEAGASVYSASELASK